MKFLLMVEILFWLMSLIVFCVQQNHRNAIENKKLEQIEMKFEIVVDFEIVVRLIKGK